MSLSWLKHKEVKEVLRESLANPPGRVSELQARVKDLEAKLDAFSPGKVTPELSRDIQAFRRREKGWLCVFGGKAVLVKSRMFGLEYIATLLSQPRERIPAIVLESMARNPRAKKWANDRLTNLSVHHENLSPGNRIEQPENLRSGSAPQMDPECRRAVQERIEELEGKIVAQSDPGRVVDLKEELDRLSQYLKAGTGILGKTRRLDPENENARVRVTNCIKAAIRTIGEEHPLLADHLRANIKTGGSCCYTPGPDFPFNWII